MRINHPRAILAAILASAVFPLSLAHAKDAESIPGEFLVKLKVPVKGENLQDLEKKLSAKIENMIPELRIVRIQKPTIQREASVIKQLSQNPIVEVVEPNYIYRAIKTPNDPLMLKLWGLKNVGQSDERGAGVSGVDIDAERAWDITTGSDDVVVAVIDTGVDEKHPDLAANMWSNEAEANGEAGVDDDGNGYVDDIHGFNFVDAAVPTPASTDDHGHGSHCAGTIGGRGDDEKGIVGVSWNVKIMAVKFLGADGGGSLEGAILAIDYATKMKAKILSNSWGGGGESELLKEAIERSHQAGALFVAAAGNDSSDNDDSPHYPSNYNVANVIAVAAIDNQGNLAYFSNYGKRAVHIAAPGVNIFSSITNGGYDSWSGTSMATPHVSGIAALLASAETDLSNVELKQRLISTVRPLAGVKGKVSSNGLANAYFALTNQIAPPDLNDPAHWNSQVASFSTTHPYSSKANQSFEIEIPEASEIALYFEKFETEKGYDKLTLFDRDGNKLAELSGRMDDSYSPTIKGNYVKAVFTSDDTVEKYGIDLTKVAFR